MSTSQLTIGKRTFIVEDTELPQVELNFYVDNPRVYSVLRNKDIEPTQEEIQKLMTDMDHVKQLKLSIESNGGLIDPLIVRGGDLVVLEGNSRLAAYRLLCRSNPIQWGMVKCKVLPEDIDDSAIFTLLGQYHIVGRKDWSPFEQAGYLYRRHIDTKLPIEAMSKELGITTGDAKKYVEVYKFMIEQNDLEPSQWSYYEELLKNRAIKAAAKKDPKVITTIVGKIKTREIGAAADIRKVGTIVEAGSKSKEAKTIATQYMGGKVSLETAIESLKDTGDLDEVFQRLNKFKEYINSTEVDKKIRLSNPETIAKTMFEIERIIKRLQSIRSKYDGF